jgi:hypothetical protein
MLKPGVTYEFETWSMKVKDKVTLNECERNIFGKACEAVTEEGET